MELLYVNSSHPLAPAMYELEATYGHLKTEQERATKVRREVLSGVGRERRWRVLCRRE